MFENKEDPLVQKITTHNLFAANGVPQLWDPATRP